MVLITKKSEKNLRHVFFLLITKFCNGFNNKKLEKNSLTSFTFLLVKFCNSFNNKKSENIHILNPDIQDLSHWKCNRNLEKFCLKTFGLFIWYLFISLYQMNEPNEDFSHWKFSQKSFFLRKSRFQDL